jgi:phospholipid-binding lipoprotein MlaA
VKIYTNPLHYIDLEPEVSIPLDILGILDERVHRDIVIKLRDETSIDPYIFMRDAYLQYRRILIYGEKAQPVEPDFYDTDSTPSTSPATTRTTSPSP